MIHAAELAKITPHTDVIITGQGVSGLVITQVIKQFSPRSLVVTDLKDANLALARKYGATHTYKMPSEHAATMDTVGKDFPNGFEVVVPCLLDGDMMSDALDLLALGGRIVAYGAIDRLLGPHGALGAARARAFGRKSHTTRTPRAPLTQTPTGCIGPCKNFDFFKAHRKRAEIYLTEPRRDVDMRRYFQEGVEMVLDGIVNTSEMITHIYPLERVQEAFQLRNDKSVGNEAIHVLIDVMPSEDGSVKPIVRL